MSTMIKKFPLFFAVIAHIFFLALAGFAQDFEIKVKIVSPQNSLIHIEANFPKGETRKNLSFLQNYADAERLDVRIENLKIKDAEKREISFAESSAGEYLAAENFSSVSYNLKISVPENVLTTAHISWLTETHGLLMLNDLLPDFGEKITAKISFELPQNWKISASQNQTGEKIFQVPDVQNAVFLVGANWQNNSIPVADSIVNFSTVGEWNFENDAAAKLSGEILREYRKIFGAIPEKQINVFLLRFPRNIGFERWRAETRGSNVTILSSPTAFENREIQRLHEQLRHEFFHLWIPNNLKLTGDYSWFYEGFTQYAALKTGLKLNRITFSDFLNTLEQAVNQHNRQNQTISLLEASKTRWTGANSGVYSEGMLIAFLCDTALLRENRGKIDLLEIFRRIHQKHHLTENQTDGNTAVLKILQSYKELAPIVEKYIKGANKINLADDLETTGIELAATEDGQKLRIKTNPNRRERDLLNKLGYNNWRKLLNNPR